jgi:hypothetical protein
MAPRRLDPSLSDQTSKIFKGPVEGTLYIIGKTTTGQFPMPDMIADAFATNTFSRARLVGAITLVQILFLPAFHRNLPRYLHVTENEQRCLRVSSQHSSRQAASLHPESNIRNLHTQPSRFAPRGTSNQACRPPCAIANEKTGGDLQVATL